MYTKNTLKSLPELFCYFEKLGNKKEELLAPLGDTAPETVSQ